MRQAKSLTGILRGRSRIQGDALAFRFLRPPGTVFITTSGKVCRGATRQAYMAGALKSPGPASPADAFLVPGALGAPGGTGGNDQ